eukprot:m.57718 g.57718  ORF g.57718 m.57718 type:complete len:737 (+) comp6849_c0_seq2:13-2223(+)
MSDRSRSQSPQAPKRRLSETEPDEAQPQSEAKSTRMEGTLSLDPTELDSLVTQRGELLLTIPTNYMSKVIGRGGGALRQARVLSGARVEMVKDRDDRAEGSGLLRIGGSAVAIRHCLAIIRLKICPYEDQALYAQVLSACHSHSSTLGVLRFEVLEDQVGRLMGKNGENIRRMQDKYDVMINVIKVVDEPSKEAPAAEDRITEDNAQGMGEADDGEHGEERQDRDRQADDDDVLQVHADEDVPENGATTATAPPSASKEKEKEKDALVVQRRMCTICGVADTVASTFEELMQTMVYQFQPMPEMVGIVRVGEDHVGRVIGRSGMNLREFKMDSGCTLSLSRTQVPGTKFRELSLTGKPAQIARCIRIISDKIAGKPARPDTRKPDDRKPDARGPRRSDGRADVRRSDGGGAARVDDRRDARADIRGGDDRRDARADIRGGEVRSADRRDGRPEPRYDSRTVDERRPEPRFDDRRVDDRRYDARPVEVRSRDDRSAPASEPRREYYEDRRGDERPARTEERGGYADAGRSHQGDRSYDRSHATPSASDRSYDRGYAAAPSSSDRRYDDRVSDRATDRVSDRAADRATDYSREDSYGYARDARRADDRQDRADRYDRGAPAGEYDRRPPTREARPALETPRHSDRKEPQGYDRAPRSSDRGVERSASRSNTTEMTFLIPAEKITRLLSEFSKIEAYTHTQIIYEAHTQRRGAPQEVRIVGTPADVLQCNQELVDRLKR